MEPSQEERRRENREKYLLLRFYAKAVSLLSYVALGVSVLFAGLAIALAEVPVPMRVSVAFGTVLVGGIAFIFLQATAQTIYLLFDVARYGKASRELLEKAAADQPRPASGD